MAIGHMVQYDFNRDEYVIDGVRVAPHALVAMVNPNPDVITVSRRDGETLVVEVIGRAHRKANGRYTVGINRFLVDEELT